MIEEIQLQKPALFLDYDGTLVPISINPEDALASTDLIQTLEALDLRYRMFIVTGRSLQEITGFIGSGFNIIALHGAMTSLKGDIRYNIPDFEHYVKICDDLYSKKGIYIRQFTGLRMYNKGGNLLFHTGLMLPEYFDQLKDLVNELAQDTGMSVYIGKRIMELRIPDINKGIAIKKYSAGMKKLIAGDDSTDEDAFKENPDAITIHVGPGESISRYRLSDPGEMLILLKKIV
ncbi:MAG: trehalose-phosphatase [Thermoplasmata archaeon]